MRDSKLAKQEAVWAMEIPTGNTWPALAAVYEDPDGGRHPFLAVVWAGRSSVAHRVRARSLLAAQIECGIMIERHAL